jgi:cytochrome c556
MTKLRLLSGAAVLAGLALTVSGICVAQDLIGERKAAMRFKGANAKVASDMVRGTVPFDAAKAAEAMGNIVTTATNLPKLFPPGSTAGETRASPKIWEDLAGFQATAAKMAADATAAQKAAAAGADAFKAAFGNVTQNCQTCHDAYRTARK